MTREEILEELAIWEAYEARLPILRPQKTNGPQTAAYNCTAQIVGYGGAAGGGKSVYGAMSALYKSHNAVIIRRTLKMHVGLTNWLKSKFPQRLFGNPPEFKATAEDRKRGIKCKTLRFAYLDHEDDLENEQGIPKDKIIVDEAVHLPWEWINRLTAHNRSDNQAELDADGLVCQTILTFNPPLTPVGLWVFELFAPWINDQHEMYPQAYGRVLYYAYIDGRFFFYETDAALTVHPVTGNPIEIPIELKSITFFRATWQDNESFRENRAYIASLQNQADVEYRAFFLGEMTASLVDDAKYIFPRSKYIACEKRWKETEPPKGPPLVVAIDVTGGGEDQFCMMPMWKGGYAGKYVQRQGSLLPNADAQVDFLEEYVQGTLHCAIMDIDYIYDSGGGYGDAFHDAMMRRYPEARLNAFRGGGAAGINDLFGINNADETIGELSGMPFLSGSNGFTNCVSAAWCRAGQMTYHPLFNLAIYPDDDLRRQCTGREITERGGGKLAIEKKEDYKAKLGGKSPDAADCLVMGLWYLSVVMAVDEWSQRSR